MRNSWFRFKEFTIIQEHSAMKVSTDACIQGAWAASLIQSRFQRNSTEETHLLDIGTGTGLLSLMLAQILANCKIDAIEAEPTAAQEAAYNFEASKWSDALSVQQTTLQQFETDKQYDFIICNPPFFHKHLQAPDIARNKARHDIGLSKEELAFHAHRLLADGGLLCVMYPATEWDAWLKAAAGKGFKRVAQLDIVPASNKPANRVVAFFSLQKNITPTQEILHIRDAENSYTKAFQEMMQPYYL